MTTTQVLTFDPFASHRQFARLAPHFGKATLQLGDTTISGDAEFLVPAAGNSIAAIYTDTDSATQDFGRNLVIEGSGENGAFRIDCPQVYVRRPVPHDSRRWCSLVSPVNAPARIAYGAQRLVVKAEALLNNFDYETGDLVTTKKGGFTRQGTPLAVNAGNRPVTFRHRSDRAEVLPLVRARLVRSASLVEIGFEAGASESDDSLLALAVNVAALCTFASGVGVGVPLLNLLDADGAVIRRVVPQPITWKYRENEIVEDSLLPRLFSEAFDEYVSMKRAHEPWVKLATYCASLDDPPILEQKFASLIMALEYLMRNSLIEAGQPEDSVTALDLEELIGATRKHLGWSTPKHYTARHTIQLFRNAVIHGDELPTKDITEFRLLFDKWKLFLFRRVLIRLGYKGRVVSPHNGWSSRSDVADFREEHNSFAPEDSSAPNALSEFVTRLREHKSRADDHSRTGPVTNTAPRD